MITQSTTIYCYIFDFFPVKNLLQGIGYYISLPFIYLLSALPFPLLYLFSDLVFVIIYHVIRYRRGVVYQKPGQFIPGKAGERDPGNRKALFPLFL